VCFENNCGFSDDWLLAQYVVPNMVWPFPRQIEMVHGGHSFGHILTRK
jgi:isopentenyl phosphate kinase